MGIWWQDDEPAQGLMQGNQVDPDVKKLISGIYGRIDKAADAEGRRFESVSSPSSL